MRYAFALVVLAVALPVALFLHRRDAPVTVALYTACSRAGFFSIGATCPADGYIWISGHTYQRSGTDSIRPRRKAEWQDPVALAVLISGAALALGIVAVNRF